MSGTDHPGDGGEWASPATLNAGDKIEVDGRVRTVARDVGDEGPVHLKPTHLTSVDVVQLEDLDETVEVVRAEGAD